MNKVFFLGVLVLAIIGFSTGCSNELDVNGEWKDIGVVYGLLNASESRQIIRVNKAFLDTEAPYTGGETIAQIADSLYYPESITVYLERYNFLNTNTGKPEGFENSVALTRALASEIGLPAKDPGIFSNDPYYVYYTDVQINPLKFYQVKFTTESGEVITASTPVVESFDVILPIQPPSGGMFFSNTSSNTFVWKKPANAFAFDVVLNIQYDEIDELDYTIVEPKSLDIVLESNKHISEFSSTGVANLNYSLDWDDFLNQLSNKIQVKTGIFRQLKTMSFKVYGGSQQLYNYYQIALASQSSINNGSANDPYTNVENGVGLLASTNVASRTYDQFHVQTLEDLSCNSITADLKFAPSTESPNWPYCQ